NTVFSDWDFDRVSYSGDASITASFTSAGGSVTGATSGTDTLVLIDLVIGTEFADYFTVDSTYDGKYDGWIQFEGGGGDDVIDGNGNLRIHYDGAFDSVTVDLAGGSAYSTNSGDTAEIGVDDLSAGGVYSVQASNFNDTLIGSSANESFRGMAGNDSIDGGSGTDEADYGNSWNSVTVDLSGGAIGAGTAQDGFGGTDTLVGIENIRGSWHDDVLTGDAGDNRIRGREGDDTIYGHDGDDSLRGGQGNDIVYGGAGDDDLRGGEGDDVLHGDGGWNLFYGDAGNDIIYGTTDFDGSKVTYGSAEDGINVTLSTDMTVVGDESVGTDTLHTIDSIYGSGYNDTLTIDSNYVSLYGDKYFEFEGAAGNDTITGTGELRVSYNNASAAVTVNLQSGTAYSTAAGDIANVGVDNLTTGGGISQVRGSSYDDTITGSNGAWFESFRGQAGDDVIDGGGGELDRVDYWNSSAAVTVDLSAATAYANDGFGTTDTLYNIEGARGSVNYGDTLIGNDGDNFFEGKGGDDTIIGGGGLDTLDGGSGADTFVYSSKTDSTVSEPDFIEDFTSGEDTIEFTGMAGITYETTPWTFVTSMAATIADIEANATDDSVIFFTESGTDEFGPWTTGYLYVKGSGLITSGEAGDFAGTLIGMKDVSSAPSIADIDGISVALNPVIGTSGDDELIGTSEGDSIIAQGGDDTIIASSGGDYLDGGADNDTVDFSQGPGRGVSVDLSQGSATDTSGAAETLLGGMGQGYYSAPETFGTLVEVTPSGPAGSLIGDPTDTGTLVGLGVATTGSVDTVYGIHKEDTGERKLITIDPDTGDLISTIGVVNDGTSNISIIDLAVQPGSNVIYGLDSNGNLHTIAASSIDSGVTVVATLVGYTGNGSSG
ncbi:MAG: hypothetical protein HOK06_05360, partial [Rhodospirillaceae bacterium]|nr:hypothetical protein [Rhodospirillaceae bacterium]